MSFHVPESDERLRRTLDSPRLGLGLISPKRLPRRQFHVWRASVPARRQLEELVGRLDPVEQSRAARLSDPAARDRLIASHVMVRCLLASYLPFPLVRSVVKWSSRGEKPKLRWPYRLTRINLSVSSSHEQVMVALSRGSVGVDVQWEEDLLGLPKRGDRAIPPSSWSRLEAVVKMRGTGLDELDRFEATGPSPVKVVDKTGLQTRIVATDLEVPTGYLGAVVGPEGYQVIERIFEYPDI